MHTHNFLLDDSLAHGRTAVDEDEAHALRELAQRLPRPPFSNVLEHHVSGEPAAVAPNLFFGKYSVGIR